MVNTRVTVQFRFAITAVSLLIATSLIGCKADSNYFTTSNSSVGSGDGSSKDATAGFRIRLKAKDGVKGFLHKFGDIAEACEVPLASKETPTEVNCMMNMLEYDLWFYGYEYEVNVPAGTAESPFCSYLLETPHRYYKGQAGYGPQTATITMTDGVMTICNIGGIPATINAAQQTCGNSEVVFTASGTLLSCEYNYGQQVGNVRGPNCCQGEANVNVTTVSTVGAPPPAPTSVTTKIDYGGRVSNCLESTNDFIPTWPKITGPQIAATLVKELGAGGLVRSQKLPSAFELDSRSLRSKTLSDFLNAGFHGWNVYQSSAATFDQNVVIPKAMKPDFDYGADGSHSGTDATPLPQAGKGAVVFECLNAAGEVKHRINMYAHAWNTIEDFEDFQANGNPATVDPNRTGVAGVDCNAVNGLGSCNSIWGFDDMVLDTTGFELGCSGDPTAYCYPYEGSRPSPP